MKAKRVLGMFLAVTLTMGTLMGCGGKGEETAEPSADPSEEEEITLRVLATGTDYPEVIDEAVKEKFPNVTLEWETISWNDLNGKMQQYMQSGMPDIVIGKSQDANNYGKYNVWADLTDKPYMEKVSAQALPGVTIEDKVLGMSCTALYGGVFYNKKIFKDQHLEVPTTWDEMEEVVKKLNDAGITPFATHYMENILYTTCLYTLPNMYEASATWGEDFKNGERNAEDPEFKGGYEKVKYMMENSWEDTYSIDQTTCDARFVKGEAAMQVDGSWCINNYLVLDDSFEFGLFPVPNENGDAKLVFEPDITFFQSADTKYPDLIDDIFALMTESDVIGGICDSVSEGSLVEGANVTFTNPSQSDIDMYTEKGQIFDINLIGCQTPAAGFWDECSSDLSEWLHGNMSLEDALKNADSRRNLCGFKEFE